MSSNFNKTTNLNICRLFFFFFISTYGLRRIFTSVYFKQLGLSPTHTGILQGASPISKAFGGFTFGYVADRTDSRKIIFLTSLLACAVTPFLTTLPKPKKQHCMYLPSRSSQLSTSQSQKHGNKTALNVTNNLFKKSAQRHDSSSLAYSNELRNSTKIKNVTEIDEIHLDLGERQSKTNFNQSEASGFLHFSNVSKSAHSINELAEVLGSKSTRKQKLKMGSTLDDADMTNLFAILLFITIIGDFISGPAFNLADTAIMHHLDEDKEGYGKVRLWSNVGQMVLIPLVAVIVHFEQVIICGILFDNYIISLYVVSGGMLVAFFVGYFVQMPSSNQLSTYFGDEKNTMTIKEFLRNFLWPLENWSLLVNAFFFGFFISTYQTFLFWTMIDLNPSQASLSVGVANFSRNISALISYYASTVLLRYIATMTMLNISHGLYLVSFVIAAFFRNPWLAIIPEILVYPAVAFSTAACVMHVGKTAPQSWSATAQAILQFLYNGIGCGVGPLVTGVVMDNLGQTYTYLSFAGLTLLVMTFSLVVQLILKLTLTDDKYQPIPNGK